MNPNTCLSNSKICWIPSGQSEQQNVAHGVSNWVESAEQWLLILVTHENDLDRFFEISKPGHYPQTSQSNQNLWRWDVDPSMSEKFPRTFYRGLGTTGLESRVASYPEDFPEFSTESPMFQKILSPGQRTMICRSLQSGDQKLPQKLSVKIR